MAESTMPKFPLPPDMRFFAEQSVEQARMAFETFIAATQRAVSAFEGHATAAQAGAKDIQEKAVSYTERNIAASFEFAQRLLGATSTEELVRLHADHVRGQIEALTEQAQDLSRTAAAAINRATPKS